jgi:hypothetical protein
MFKQCIYRGKEGSIVTMTDSDTVPMVMPVVMVPVVIIANGKAARAQDSHLSRLQSRAHPGRMIFQSLPESESSTCTCIT